MVIKSKSILILLTAVLSVSLLAAYVLADAGPSGATVVAGTPNRSSADSPQTANAYAGNITMLTLGGYTITQTCTGYWGNVSSKIPLRDSSNNTLYNWTLASPSGEVYASTNSSISWLNIQCFNFTATGNFSTSGEQAGNYSINGTNLTTLETRFNISSADVDGVDETFTFQGAGTHDKFFTGPVQFNVGQCHSTRVFDNTGAVSDHFEEALLYEPVSTSVIFASLIESNMVAFNGATADFEMMVLDNGHGTDTAVTTYFLYVEIQ